MFTGISYRTKNFMEEILNFEMYILSKYLESILQCLHVHMHGGRGCSSQNFSVKHLKSHDQYNIYPSNFSPSLHYWACDCIIITNQLL